MSEYGPSLRLCAMYKRTSQAGKTFFTGRMGFNKVALVKTSKTTDDNVEIWSLLISEIPKETEQPRESVDNDGKLADEVPF